MLKLALYTTMFLEGARWHALRTAARIAYVVLVGGGAVVGFIVGAIAMLAVIAFAIFALVAIVVGLLHLVGAFRVPIHLAVSVAILGFAGLVVLFAIPMLAVLRAVTRR